MTTPNGILRSVIDFGGISQTEMVANMQKLIAAKLEWETPADNKLFTYAAQFYRERQEVPAKVTMLDYFESTRDLDTLERLKDLEPAQYYIRTNYSHLLSVTSAEQKKYRAIALLKEAQEIIAKGLIFKETNEKKQGLKDGVQHFMRNVQDLLKEDHNTRIEGDITEDGQEVWDEYLNAKANKALAWGKFCGINNIDAVVKGVKRGEMWLHAAYTGELKCLAGDATILDLESGVNKSLAEMFTQGYLPLVTALDREGKTHRLVSARASHLVQNGVREVFDLVLTSGKQVGATSNHKFFTPGGWVELGHLNVGDWVAVPNKMRVPTPSTSFTDGEVKILGYLLGDGSMTSYLSFTATNGEIRQDFKNCLLDMGLQEGPADYVTASFREENPEGRAPCVRISHSTGAGNSEMISPVRTLLDRLGLWGSCAQTKHIPNELYGLSEDQTALLLGALWSTDGSCHTKDHERNDRVSKCKRNDISYASVSHQLCLGVQSLLLRLGIESSVTKTHSKYKGEPYTFFTLRVVSNYSKRLFATKIEVVGKRGRFDTLLARLPDTDGRPIPSVFIPPDRKSQKLLGYSRHSNGARKRPTITRDSAYDFVTPGDAELNLVLEGDLSWERVTSISLRGLEMTYDLSVPDHHSFVVNDIVTHNTTFALNWAYNLVTAYRTNVFYASLEMPYEQIRQQICVMHSSNSRFTKLGFAPLEYDNVKNGTLSEKDESFYQLVLRDLNNNEEYGHFQIWSPDDNVTIEDIKAKAELHHKDQEIGLLIIDHDDLVEARKNKRGKDYTIELNSVLRDAKKLALHFNHGEKIPVLLLFQINRDGKSTADKTEGNRYKLSALSYANEAERSADMVTTTYLNDDHRREGTTQFDCLKRRDGPFFEPFNASIDWRTRRLSNYDPLTSKDRGLSVDDHRKLQDSVDNMFDV